MAGWSKRLHAWLISKGSAYYNRAVDRRKRALFGVLEGDVLEIGAGAGANLPYYRRDVRLIGVEPNPHMHRYFRREAERRGIAVDIRTGVAESLPVPSQSMDAVVSTLVLCTVPDVEGALREILRVLKPGGRFVFLEHVAAPEGTVGRRVQLLIRPVWGVIADGCRPDRETWTAIERAGFARVAIERFRLPAPVVGPHIQGVAVK